MVRSPAKKFPGKIALGISLELRARMESAYPKRTTRARRCGSILFACFLFLGICALIYAQDTLPPALARQIAPGVAALKSGDLNTAEKVFNEALRKGVKHPLVFHNLGVIVQERGNHLQAISRFREAILLQPNYAPSHLLLGASLLALKRNTEAVRELRRAAALMPQEPQAHLQLAKAYEATENWGAAVEELQKLTKLFPQDSEYSYQLAKGWRKLSEWSYQQIVRINPKSARLQQALGLEYTIQEKYDLALEAYKKAAQADPKLPEVHLGMAVVLLQLRRFDEALQEIEAEQKLVPESKAAAETRARIEATKAAQSP